MKILYVTLAVILGDQATKLLIKGFSIPAMGIHVQGIPLGTTIPILGNFGRLTYIENPGMAFGIDVGGKLFFSLFSIIASLGILFYLYKMRNERLLFRFSLALILGGAIGNLIDRVFYGVLFNDGGLFYGKVVDFIDIDFFNINILGYHLSRWPIFNIADSSVTVGVLILLIFHRSFVSDEEQSEKPSLESAATSPETPPKVSL
ncbi:MAG: signal peptidase II [Bacteroidota bacterium]